MFTTYELVQDFAAPSTDFSPVGCLAEILPGAEEKEAPWQHQPAFNGGPPEPRNREVCEHNSDILRHNSNLT